MAKYEMGQEIIFNLSVSKEIGEIVSEKVSEDEVYYFEITEKLIDNKYKGKLVGINVYMKKIM